MSDSTVTEIKGLSGKVVRVVGIAVDAVTGDEETIIEFTDYTRLTIGASRLAGYPTEMHWTISMPPLADREPIIPE
jgi:hypothetical protein